MRILPRTKRGTWALAIVAWLGGCALIWLLLPGVPRVVVSAADGGSPHGFTEDGRWLYGFSCSLEAVSDPDQRFSHRLWDSQTGRLMASWRETGGAYVPDARKCTGLDTFQRYGALLLFEDGPGGRRSLILDLLTGRREEVPWSAPGDEHAAFLTIGGRYLVLVTGMPESPTTYWWDRTTRQMVGTCPGLKPYFVKPDGLWVTEDPRSKEDDNYCLVVREPFTGRESARVVVPKAFEETTPLAPSSSEILLRFRNNDGRPMRELPGGRASIPPEPCEFLAVFTGLQEARSMSTDANNDVWVSSWDLTTGKRLSRRWFSSSFTAGVCGSQRFVLVWKYREAGSLAAARQFLARLPIVGRYFRDNLPMGVTVWDDVTEQEIATISDSGANVVLSPDANTLVVGHGDGQIEFWDIPPHKPLSWLAIAAGVWALPVVWFARRRIKKLASWVA